MIHAVRSILVILLAAAPALAQEGQAVGPADGASPLLEQLDREMRRLHASVQASVVRVQLPPPKWVAELLADEHPAGKWKDLDPKVKAQLETQQRRAAAGQYDAVGAVIIPPATQPAHAPATQPAGNDDEAWRIGTGADGAIRLESRIDRGDSRMLIITRQGGEQSGTRVEARPAGAFMPNNIAIVLDEAGHLLVPIYLERDQLAQPVPVSLDAGVATTASFVGSDRQTNLTVLKADQPIGTPGRIASGARPATGALVMILSPTNDTARLGIWTGGAGEWGVVVQTDGAISGFVRHGQFLSAGLAKPVVDQLIEKGRVDRPTLGLVVAEVRMDDPLRTSMPDLRTQPAMLVRKVLPDSPAAAAGLRGGDIILTLDGHAVGDVPTLAAAIAQCDQRATLTLLREGQRVEVVVDVNTKP